MFVSSVYLICFCGDPRQPTGDLTLNDVLYPWPPLSVAFDMAGVMLSRESLMVGEYVAAPTWSLVAIKNERWFSTSDIARSVVLAPTLPKARYDQLCSTRPMIQTWWFLKS